MNGDANAQHYNLVKGYIQAKGNVERVSIAQGLKVSVGDVAAIADRLSREGFIRSEAVGARGPRYHWIGKGVTEASPAPAARVTPEDPPAEGVTRSRARSSQRVTPKRRANAIRKNRANAIASAIEPGNGAAGKIAGLVRKLGDVAEAAGSGNQELLREELTRLAGKAISWRIELLTPEQRKFIEQFAFDIRGGTS